MRSPTTHGKGQLVMFRTGSAVGRIAVSAVATVVVLVAGPTGLATAQPAPDSIGPGSTNATAVGCVQRTLAVETAGAPLGTYGPATAAAVRVFQQENGLPAIGSVGPATGALLAARAPADCTEVLSAVAAQPDSVPEGEGRSFTDCPLLLEGLHHGCVARLQNDLNAVNPEYDLPGTDFFGRDTRVAVLDFQGRHRLPADGNVGAQTADLLAEQAGNARQGTGAPPVPPAAPGSTRDGVEAPVQTGDATPGDRRAECAVPRPDAAAGPQASEQWAVDQYIHGCSDAGSGKPWFTTNFGAVSNSYYFSPEATRSFDEWLDGHRNIDSQAAIGSFALCASVRSLACEALGLTASVMFNDVKNATEDAVERRSCLKVTDHAELWTTAEATAVDNKYCRKLQ